jgi:peptidoglycan/xylan/chitin deacetylase (PgdA/CDA1 family)
LRENNPRDGRVPAFTSATNDRNRLIVTFTVDTEPDNPWENHPNTNISNVLQLPHFQDLLSRTGAVGTYLVTYQVLQDKGGLQVLHELKDRGAEIGAHLHPWETPPYLADERDKRYQAFPHELPLGLFSEKLENLTSVIKKEFGSPTSYRGGRWGFCADHVAMLEQLGYEVDTSVTPLVDWRSTEGIPRSRGGIGGPDYRRAPWGPYQPARSDVTRPGYSRLTEVPVSVGLSRRFFRVLRRHYGYIPGIAQRVTRRLGILRAVFALPAEETWSGLERLGQDSLTDGHSVLNIAIHSSEVVLGKSPRSATPAQVEVTLGNSSRFLSLLARNPGASFQALTNAAREFNTWNGKRAEAGPAETNNADRQSLP